MGIDLYKDDLTTARDDDLYKAIESFTRMKEPIENRPRENYILDYKQEWGAKALHTVAAFANTFGGLLVVGVGEDDARPATMLGIESAGEEKTRIASSIASNISPTPPFDIAECTLRGDPKRRLLVLRVRRGPTLYYLTTKGERPIYVRNDSESRPADAAQLRALIERKQGSSEFQRDLSERIQAWDRKEVIHTTVPLVSRTFFSILVLPFDRLRIQIDQSLENQFDNLIERGYPRLAERINNNIANATGETGRDSYEITWREV